MHVIIANLPFMMRGLKITLLLAGIAMLGSLVIGTVLAVIRMTAWRAIRVGIAILIDLGRMVPLIMVIFWIFFLLPLLTGHSISPLTAAIVALILFNSSYMAEIVRAGIGSVPSGLSEAARASGLTGLQTMCYLVMPIAFRRMLPAMINRFVTIFMGTSLAYTIGVTEFFRAATEVNSRVFQPIPILLFVAAVYFILCFGISLVGTWLTRYFARADGKPA